MSKAGKQITASMRELLDTVTRARELFEQEGNPPEVWHAEDEITRLYYLRLAAQTEETTKPALQIQ